MRASHATSRAPAVAGLFYPRSAEMLARTLEDLLDRAQAGACPHTRGIIAPHAAYRYSGGVAAEAFASVSGLKGRVRRAVIVGLAHYVRFDGIAAPSFQAFATPLGELPVDAGAVAHLVDGAFVTIDD